MSYFLVQQWWFVPGYEGYQMSDASRIPNQAAGNRGAGSPQGRFEENQLPQPAASRPQQYHSQTTYTQPSMSSLQGEEQTEGSLSMGSMASVLPSFRPPQSLAAGANPHRVHSVPPPPPIQPQQLHLPPMTHHGAHALNTPGGNTNFSPQYMPPINANLQGNLSGAYLVHQTAHQTRGGIASPVQQSFPQQFLPGQQQHSSQYIYYPQVYNGANPPQGLQGIQRQTDNSVYTLAAGIPLGLSAHSGPHSHTTGTLAGRGGLVAVPEASRRPNTTSTVGSIPAAPRGPPRKPKQSGHALWVGNLPPGAKVIDLKDHFSRDATKDIESVFLISKSNCAFVNYRTEDACTAAMNRFHESRFQGVRLVCRLRRTTPITTSPGIPTGPSALSSAPPQSQTAVEAIHQNRQISSRAEESMRQLEGANKINDKYFIVKSLTLEDLELSARNGIWATQSHNEEALNRAFESVDNVYLVFSANKSGEYFGYARMVSPISEEVSKDLDWAPRAEAVIDDSDLPRAIPTAATETAPKGRVIDDSARGTIFWEAEALQLDPLTPAEAGEDEETDDKVEDEEQSSEVQTFGRPFKIEWISTTRVPFYRTRGLRNPWNANREVKIARDGTELETSVGRRLIEMFNKPPGGIQPPVLQPNAGTGIDFSNNRTFGMG